MNKKDNTYVTNRYSVARPYLKKSAKYVLIMMLFIVNHILQLNTDSLTTIRDLYIVIRPTQPGFYKFLPRYSAAGFLRITNMSVGKYKKVTVWLNYTKGNVNENNYHYDDVIMSTKASRITSLTTVYLIVYSRADQRKHQSSASLAFVRGIHRRPVNSPQKGPVARKMVPFDDVIMYTSD